MHDVAALAGVSHQTVSRVVNGSANLRPQTRERVVAAIEELGYRRNLAARVLVTGRTHSIGILTPGPPDYGKMRSVQAVEQATRDAGFFPLVTSSASDADGVGAALEFLMDRSIEALVVVAPHSIVLERVGQLDAKLPIATLQTGGYDPSHAVAIDQGQGVREAVEHLIALGHTAIQQVCGPTSYFEAQMRRDAFEATMAAHGLSLLPMLEGDWSPRSGFECGERLDSRATAVFCANDQMALGLIHAVVAGGRTVPGDVSVVGFDDIPEAAHSLPPLTTVHQDFEGVGRRAVELIVAQINDSAVAHAGMFTPWLVERESVAAIR